MNSIDTIHPQPAPAVLGPVSWAPPHELSFEEWARQGHRLGAAGRGVGWWIGDWLNYGEAVYGEHYVRASQITGYEVQSLMNMAYVASRFATSRRRESLSWSHHAELAALSPEDQDAWLDRIDAERISVKDLRSELRRAQATPTRADRHELDRPDGTVCPACGHRFAP
jgi:hypothetical protein